MIRKRETYSVVHALQKATDDWGETYSVVHALQKATDDCNTPFSVPVKAAETKCIPQCKGISGTITTLTTDLTYLDDEVGIHIDKLVLDFTRVNEEVDDFGHQS
jgi:hypothetical protein